MHELLHLIGFCTDSFSHLDLMDYVAANYRNLILINFKALLLYVIKR